jgi:amidohydrolase
MSTHAGAPAAVVDTIVNAVDDLANTLFDVARDLHDHPEVGFEESYAVDAIRALLAEHGADMRVGAHGLPTAFQAAAGSGSRPCVAIVAEYDALPGIGHGCGHNLIAASAIGAFLAMHKVVDDTGGQVRLVGTPAEENGGGKELILQADGFDGVDAAIMAHPGHSDVADPGTLTGRRVVKIVYTGTPAHAATHPHLGRNALDAAVMAYQGVAQLRQHILPTDRLHCIITDGGQVPNVVPERAALTAHVRSTRVETLAELSGRVDQVFRAAALASGTECELHWDPIPPYLPLRSNRVLAGRYAAALAGRRQVALAADPGEGGGSTDMGNVSHWVPTIQPMIAFAPPDVPGHSAEFARLTTTPAARRVMVDGALALACVAADFLSDPGIRAAANSEFEDAGGQNSAQNLTSATI